MSLNDFSKFFFLNLSASKNKAHVDSGRFQSHKYLRRRNRNVRGTRETLTFVQRRRLCRRRVFLCRERLRLRQEQRALTKSSQKRSCVSEVM